MAEATNSVHLARSSLMPPGKFNLRRTAPFSWG